MNAYLIQRFLSRFYVHSAFFLSIVIIIGFLEAFDIVEVSTAMKQSNAFSEICCAGLVGVRQCRLETKNFSAIFLTGSVFFGFIFWFTVGQ